MYDNTSLLPPIRVINEKLTQNQRERRRLHALLRLALEADDDQQKPRNARQQKPRNARQAAPQAGGGR
ncbi:MAG TPA: hypothetical protein VFF52_22220 [Isosphaeraceae bacterium]|nr:hypothetical protein [Isosphaeraceae bacterium]